MAKFLLHTLHLIAYISFFAPIVSVQSNRPSQPGAPNHHTMYDGLFVTLFKSHFK